jgi:hypothetical protein
MKNILIQIIALILFSIDLNAQSIFGTIRNNENKTMEAVVVSLLQSKDSSIVKMEMTNEHGEYRFKTGCSRRLYH